MVSDILNCLKDFVIYIIPCIAVLLLIYFFIKPKPYIFRKCLHLVAFTCAALTIHAAGSWIACDCVCLIIIIVIYPVLSAVEHFPIYSRIFVEKKPGEIKNSLIQLFGTLAAVTLFSWGIFGKQYIVVMTMLMWGCGDAAAALIGIPFGKHKVKWKIADPEKSWEGSGAFVITAFTAGLIGMQLTGNGSIAAVMAGSVAAAFAELVTRDGFDTVTVPLSLICVLLLF